MIVQHGTGVNNFSIFFLGPLYEPFRVVVHPKKRTPPLGEGSWLPVVVVVVAAFFFYDWETSSNHHLARFSLAYIGISKSFLNFSRISRPFLGFVGTMSGEIIILSDIQQTPWVGPWTDFSLGWTSFRIYLSYVSCGISWCCGIMFDPYISCIDLIPKVLNLNLGFYG